ncbi:Nif3-like dinuclear metal center hexameric protein [Mycoplasmopsis synoviae]|uniref:Nif3-like dinuclear metal center hexameric protein n=1 Tax=Mycoplasmopsis synoviae TaxID=2109 RepID=UPI000377283B|nr:Nif3-like dinuclear metal center hexameric protein [Mycoplasmopsis synoviae]AKB11190.1 hypothetical protein VY93_02455 [Mycoplasmopsis synoviae ATCC 25204]
MKIKELASFLEYLYPKDNAEEWDPVGFSLSYKNMLVRGVITCLDVTKEIVNFAIENNYNFIVSHHPFLFYEDLNEELNTYFYKKEIYELCKKHKISLFSLHTNYDSDKNGTSYQVAKFLNLFDSPAHKELKTVSKYAYCFKDNLSVSELAKAAKNSYKIDSLATNVSDLDAKFNSFCIIAGSGASEISQLKRQYKIDLFLSSDFKWSDYLFYDQSKINFLEIAHLQESVFALDLAWLLNQHFPDLKVKTINQISLPYKVI